MIQFWEVRCLPTEDTTKYFQYANILKPGDYEFGHNRGNAFHYNARYEQGLDGNFRTKVYRRLKIFDASLHLQST